MKGIDVSRYQGQIDFNAVKKAGIEFVIIQAGYGNSVTQKDPFLVMAIALRKKTPFLSKTI